MFSEIELPPDISSELRTNAALIVNHLAEPTDAPNRWRRRAHAPSVILVPERSGAIAASGILDWYERNHVEGLELIVVEGLGSEVRGWPMWDDIPLYMVDGEFDDVIQYLAQQIDDPAHALNAEAERTAAALARLPKGGHALGLIDDYVDRGHVAAIYTPVFLRKAAAKAGFAEMDYADIAWPVMEDVKDRLNLGYYQHRNQFSKRGHELVRRAAKASPGRRSLIFPWENIWTLLPSFSQWINGIVTATFGAQQLTDAQRYELSEWLRGRRMAQRPQAEHSDAVGAAIERGVDPAEAPAYVMSLSAHLRRKVAAMTRLDTQQGRAVCVGPDPSTEQQP